MRIRWSSVWMAGALTAALLAGCGSDAASGAAAEEGSGAGSALQEDGAVSEGETKQESESTESDYSGEIKVWVEDAAVSFTQERIAEFVKENPDAADITFTVEAVDEEDAASRILTDAETGGDIYVFTQDQLAQLAAAGVLAAVSDENAASVRKDNDAGAVRAATVGDTLYAYPLTSDDGYLLYYDSSVITDPTDLDAILADCKAADRSFCMEINSGWYQTAFFFGTGCDLSYEIDKEGGYTSANVTYASDAGVTALRKMIDVCVSGAFANSSAAGAVANIGAMVDGLQDAAVLKAALGDGYACAKLPAFTGADGKTYQMSGFSGYRLLGIRPQTDKTKQAVCEALTAYLSSGEVQQARYEALGFGPSNLEAQQSEAVQADEALTALNAQLLEDVPKGAYPGDYWTLAIGLGDDVISGNLNSKTSDKDLLAALQTFQDTCISYVP